MVQGRRSKPLLLQLLLLLDKIIGVGTQLSSSIRHGVERRCRDDTALHSIRPCRCWCPIRDMCPCLHTTGGSRVVCWMVSTHRGNSRRLQRASVRAAGVGVRRDRIVPRRAVSSIGVLRQAHNKRFQRHKPDQQLAFVQMLGTVVLRVLHTNPCGSETLPQVQGSARHGMGVVAIGHGDQTTTRAVCRVGSRGRVLCLLAEGSYYLCVVLFVSRFCVVFVC